MTEKGNDGYTLDSIGYTGSTWVAWMHKEDVTWTWAVPESWSDLSEYISEKANDG